MFVDAATAPPSGVKNCGKVQTPRKDIFDMKRFIYIWSTEDISFNCFSSKKNHCKKTSAGVSIHYECPKTAYKQQHDYVTSDWKISHCLCDELAIKPIQMFCC